MIPAVEKVLLMGSSKFGDELPNQIMEFLDSYIVQGSTFKVAEAHGSCRLF